MQEEINTNLQESDQPTPPEPSPKKHKVLLIISIIILIPALGLGITYLILDALPCFPVVQKEIYDSCDCNYQCVSRWKKQLNATCFVICPTGQRAKEKWYEKIWFIPKPEPKITTAEGSCNALNEEKCLRDEKCDPAYGSSCATCEDVVFKECNYIENYPQILMEKTITLCETTGGIWGGKKLGECDCEGLGDYYDVGHVNWDRKQGCLSEKSTCEASHSDAKWMTWNFEDTELFRIKHYAVSLKTKKGCENAPKKEYSKHEWNEEEQKCFITQVQDYRPKCLK